MIFLNLRRVAWTLAVFGWLCGRVRSDEGHIHSVVCTTQAKNGWAVNYPKQRKLFYMANLFWVFYSDGRDAVCRTSTNGIHWSEPFLIRKSASLGHRFGCWYDGARIHYAHCASGDGEDVVYRCGTPQPDGTIIWTAPEQTVYEVPAGKNVMYPKITVDSAGVPWVSFMLYDGGLRQPPYDAIVTKGSKVDGTWQTAPSFPSILVNDNTSSYPDPVGVPLTNGKTFWVYNKNLLNDVYYGRLWNGNSWEAEEAVTLSHSSDGLYNLAPEGDVVHLVFGGGTIRYRKRDPQKGWGEEFKITNSGSGHSSLTRIGPDSVTVVWLDTKTHSIHYRAMVEGQWLPPVLWLDESHERLANPELGINSNALLTSGERSYLALVYTTGAQAPFTLKFALQRTAAK